MILDHLMEKNDHHTLCLTEISLVLLNCSCKSYLLSAFAVALNLASYHVIPTHLARHCRKVAADKNNSSIAKLLFGVPIFIYIKNITADKLNCTVIVYLANKCLK